VQGRFLELACALALAAACAAPAHEGGPVDEGAAPGLIALGPDEAPPNGRLELRGFPGGEELVVHVATAPEIDPPAVLGRTFREGDALVFEPRFAFARGLAYRVSCTAPAGGAFESEVLLEKRFLEASTVVEQVYPSADELPANLLKLYVHFSAPMRRGEAYEHARVLNADGSEAREVLLEIEPELWDPQTRRLTLLFDPGRIKQGLRLRRELGPTLVAGESYVLEIDAGWRDARGAPLAAGFRKPFRTVAIDEDSPDAAQWRVAVPPAGTREPLCVEFDEPLDHALCERVIAVRDAHGERMTGNPVVGDEERRWTFVPDRAWTPGPYTLVVGPVLEDRAGNGVRRPFEIDLRAASERAGLDDPVLLPFRVVGSPR